jgi:hypothetical protein
MHVRILHVLSATLERPDARVPFIVAAQAVARSSDTEGGISSREVRLGVNDLHH